MYFTELSSAIPLFFTESFFFAQTTQLEGLHTKNFLFIFINEYIGVIFVRFVHP